MKRTEPSQSLLQGMPYTNAASTDIAARFKAIREAQAQVASKNVRQLKQKSAAK